MVSGVACDGETPAAWMTAVHRVDRRRGLDQRLDRGARGDVDRHRADNESGVAQDIGGGGCVLRAEIGEHDMLARAHPARNRLADGACADNDDDIHGTAFP